MTPFKRFVRSRAPAYEDVLNLLEVYYSAYGGARQMVRSPYAHVAILLTMATASLWTRPGWWDLPLSILPNLIGFTLSGYAVVMTISDQKLRSAMIGPIPNRPTAFMATNATFFHFLLLQILAILLALIAKSRPLSYFFGSSKFEIGPFNARFVIAWVGWVIGYCVFVYALTSALAAAAAIFRVGRWLEWSMKPDDTAPTTNPDPKE